MPTCIRICINLDTNILSSIQYALSCIDPYTVSWPNLPSPNTIIMQIVMTNAADYLNLKSVQFDPSLVPCACCILVLYQALSCKTISMYTHMLHNIHTQQMHAWTHMHTHTNTHTRMQQIHTHTRTHIHTCTHTEAGDVNGQHCSKSAPHQPHTRYKFIYICINIYIYIYIHIYI